VRPHRNFVRGSAGRNSPTLNAVRKQFALVALSKDWIQCHNKKETAVLRANELRKGKGQIEFSVAVLEGAKVRPRRSTVNPKTVTTQRPGAPYELNLSGVQVVVGLALGFCSVVLLTWGLIRHWLFAQ
jgi:hypothetical protein